MNEEQVNPVWTPGGWLCENCNHSLETEKKIGEITVFREKFNYCPKCGRKVNWTNERMA